MLRAELAGIALLRIHRGVTGSKLLGQLREDGSPALDQFVKLCRLQSRKHERLRSEAPEKSIARLHLCERDGGERSFRRDRVKRHLWLVGTITLPCRHRGSAALVVDDDQASVGKLIDTIDTGA